MSAAESPDERIAALERRIEELEARVGTIPVFTPASRTIHEIVIMAAHAWNVPPGDIYSERRSAPVVEPRWAVMWVARHALPYTLKRIGEVIGGRDHTTIMHGLRRAERLRHRDSQFRALTDAMLRSIEKLQRNALAELEAAAAARELQLEVAA